MALPKVEAVTIATHEGLGKYILDNLQVAKSDEPSGEVRISAEIPEESKITKLLGAIYGTLQEQLEAQKLEAITEARLREEEEVERQRRLGLHDPANDNIRDAVPANDNESGFGDMVGGIAAMLFSKQFLGVMVRFLGRAIPSVLRFIFTKNPWVLGAILGYGVYKNWDTITEGASSVASAVSEGVSNIFGGDDESSKPAATPTQGNYFTPLENMTVTSEFGHRKGRKHEGIDLRAPVGTPVRAYTSGVVVQAREMGGYGKQIVIRHDDGKYSRYAHLSEYQVKEGQRVNAGQQIALSGDTGISDGPHLHFEILEDLSGRNGTQVDPTPYLSRALQKTSSTVTPRTSRTNSSRRPAVAPRAPSPKAKAQTSQVVRPPSPDNQGYIEHLRYTRFTQY